jgi:hypothetical protein
MRCCLFLTWDPNKGIEISATSRSEINTDNFLKLFYSENRIMVRIYKTIKRRVFYFTLQAYVDDDIQDTIRAEIRYD